MSRATSPSDWPPSVGCAPSTGTVTTVGAASPSRSTRSPEYVIMTLLALTHRLFESVTTFRAGSGARAYRLATASRTGEVFERTIGIVGYGRIGREVAQRGSEKGRGLAST